MQNNSKNCFEAPERRSPAQVLSKCLCLKQNKLIPESTVKTISKEKKKLPSTVSP